MKCQILFSGKNKKNISKCRLLKILPRVLSLNDHLILRYAFRFLSTVLLKKGRYLLGSHTSC